MTRQLQIPRGPKERLPILLDGSIALTTDEKFLYLGLANEAICFKNAAVTTQEIDTASNILKTTLTTAFIQEDSKILAQCETSSQTLKNELIIAYTQADTTLKELLETLMTTKDDTLKTSLENFATEKDNALRVAVDIEIVSQINNAKTDLTLVIDDKILKKIDYTDIINDITTGGVAKVLSAQQGLVLKELISSLTTRIATLENEITSLKLAVEALKPVAPPN